MTYCPSSTSTLGVSVAVATSIGKCVIDTGLAESAISSERHVRIATEGALLGGLVARGVSPDLVVLSDGAGQFVVFVHAACWVRAERPLARMIPYHDEHRAVIENARDRIWEFYRDQARLTGS